MMMDSPRNEPARRAICEPPGMLIVLGLLALMVAYIWPAESQEGPIIVTFSYLRGAQFADEPTPFRSAFASALRPVVLWLLLAVGLSIRLPKSARILFIGSLALFSLSELLMFAQQLIVSEFVGPGTFVGILGALMLGTGAVGLLKSANR